MRSANARDEMTEAPEAEPRLNLGDELASEYYTPKQLAGVLNRSERTLSRWHDLRIGPPRTERVGLILYRKSSVREWLEAGEKKPVQRRRGAPRLLGRHKK